MQTMLRLTALLTTVIAFLSSVSADDRQSQTEDLPQITYVDPVETLRENFGRSLEEPVIEAPLEDVAAIIAELSEMPCRIANESLADEGFSAETRVSLASGIPLYMALDRLCLEELSPANGRGRLAWMIDLDAGEIIITTDNEAADRMVPFSYAVGDLSAEEYPGGLVPGVEFHDGWLMDAIQSHCGGEWIDIDGVGGELELTDEILQVRQPFHVQRRIDALLSALRKRAMVVYVDQPPQTAALDQLLEQIFENPIESTTLEQALQRVAEASTLDIRFEPRFVREHPGARRALTETSSSGQPFRIVLDELLGSVDFPEARLGYSLANGVLWVGYHGPGFSMKQHQETVLYNAADVMRDIDPETLEKRIYERTNGRWLEVDGLGGDISFTPYGYLVVTNTRQVHFKVLDLMEELRSDSAACGDNTIRDTTSN